MKPFDIRQPDGLLELWSVHANASQAGLFVWSMQVSESNAEALIRCRHFQVPFGTLQPC